MTEQNFSKLAIFSHNPLKKLQMNERKQETDFVLSSPKMTKQQFNISTRIESLDLSNQKISDINPDKITNIWIMKLDISNNFLRVYGNEFKVLIHLRILCIAHNYLKTLPFDFYKFHPQLSELDISNNYLSITPQMPNSLITLNIEYNQIHLFPQILDNSVQILLTTGNPFYQLKHYGQLKEFSTDWVIYLGWSDKINGPQLELLQKWLQKESQPTFQKMIKHFIGEFFNYNQVDDNGNNIIHQTAFKQHLGVLLGCSNLIDKNGLNSAKQTPIQIALFSDKYLSVKCLLSLNVNLNQQNLVIISLIKQQLHLMQGFLQHGIDPNEQDKDGNTALHYLMNKWITFQYAEKYAALLLYYGACPLMLNSQGWSPFHICVKKGYIMAAVFCLQYKGQSQLQDKCTHPFDLYQLTGQSKQTVFDICMQHNQIEMCALLLKFNEHYINCQPTSFSCLWKLISKFNYSLLKEYFTINRKRSQTQQYLSIKSKMQELGIQKKYTCCFNLTKQLNASFMKINIPNRSPMISKCKLYFQQNEQTRLKEGDNDEIEFSDSSIDSHEETKGLLPVNWSRQEYNNEMKAPKLCIESTTMSFDKESQKQNSKIKQLVLQYYNEYLLCDDLLKKEEIIIILLKLQISSKHACNDKIIENVLSQIVIDQITKTEEIHSEQSSIQQESLMYIRDIPDKLTTEINDTQQSKNYFKMRFEQWTLEYLLKYTTNYSQYFKLSTLHQFELFQL